jgi:two-component system, OmpR family, aerobic respiration control sensor histidine kinase ArcB
MDQKNTPHLLLIEDNHIALSIIEQIARHAGYTYTSTVDAESALMLIQTQSFDLIITDLGLPGMSGTELTQQIRLWENNHSNKHIPIVGLTAHAQKSIKKQCVNSGMQDAFSKPMDLKTLNTIVTQYVLTKNQSHQNT